VRPVRPSVYTQASRSTGNTINHPDPSKDPHRPTAEELKKQKEEEEKHFGERVKHAKKLSEKELEDIRKAPPVFLVASDIVPGKLITYPFYMRIPHPDDPFSSYYIHSDIVVDTGCSVSGVCFPDDDPRLKNAAADWKAEGDTGHALSVKVDIEINGQVYQDISVTRYKRWTSANGYKRAVIGLPLLRHMVLAFVGNKVPAHDLASLPAVLQHKGKITDLLGSHEKGAISKFWDANPIFRHPNYTNDFTKVHQAATAHPSPPSHGSPPHT